MSLRSSAAYADFLRALAMKSIFVMSSAVFWRISMNVSPSNVLLKIMFASCAPALSVRLLAIVVAISDVCVAFVLSVFDVCVISVLSVLRFVFSFYYKGGLMWFEPKQ